MYNLDIKRGLHANSYTPTCCEVRRIVGKVDEGQQILFFSAKNMLWIIEDMFLVFQT